MANFLNRRVLIKASFNMSIKSHQQTALRSCLTIPEFISQYFVVYYHRIDLNTS